MASDFRRRAEVSGARRLLATGDAGEHGLGAAVPCTGMTASEWLRELAERLGIDPPTEEEVEDLLALAGLAAHASERTAAPVSCWIAARAGVSAAAARQVAVEIAGSSAT
jgi:hypothetical protein